MNKFLCHHDDERRLAHRREHKKRLAELDVKRLKLSELQTILRTLEGDSEKAADSHSEQAGRLQSELDRLDAEHVEAIMAGKASSAKSLQRRGEILQEISKLNTALELQCEANRRAAIPIRKQIESLRLEIGKAQVIENELSGLCSVETRRAMMAAELHVQALNAAIANARNSAAVMEVNAEIHKRNGDEKTSHAAVTAIRLDDYRETANILGAELSRVLAEQRRLQELALSE